jgi:hypothetical protein
MLFAGGKLNIKLLGGAQGMVGDDQPPLAPRLH